MTDDEFKNKLSSVCDWELPILGQNGGPAKPNLRQKRIETIIDEFGNEQIIEEIETDENLTVSPRIKRIFPITKPCEACGQMVTNRTVSHRLYFGDHKSKRVWKVKCNECKMHKNPWTGEFNIEPNIVGRVFSAFQKEPIGQINRSDSILVQLKNKSNK